jgi:hypothetical protein
MKASKKSLLAQIDKSGPIPTCRMTIDQHRLANQLVEEYVLKKTPGPHPDGDGWLTMYFSRAASLAEA